MELGRFETDHIYCEDSYKAIKELPDKCIDCIYTDIPYLYNQGGSGNSELGERTAKKRLEWMGAYDKYKNTSLESDTLRYCELDELLSSSDVISLHCPLFPETENIINKDTIAKMKDGVIIINNSRGALIDEQALADALNSGKVYGAGLDTVRNEPISADNPLLSAKNCYITPHISWTAVEGRQRLATYAIENVKAFLDGNPKNIVNEG